MSRGAGTIVAACALAATLACAPLRAAAEAGEADIKAAYVCKFGNYVEWPASANAPERPTFGIAIAGNEGEAEVVERAAAGANVDGHPIRVRRLAAGDAPQDEHVVYVTRSQATRTAELRSVAEDRGMLLVTESAESGAAAGMVNFVIVDNKVRFDVDLAEAQAARLKLSGRLLSVARRVIGGAP